MQALAAPCRLPVLRVSSQGATPNETHHREILEIKIRSVREILRCGLPRDAARHPPLCDLPLDSRRDHSPPCSRGDYPASRARRRIEADDGADLRALPLASSGRNRAGGRGAPIARRSSCPGAAHVRLVNLQIQLERILWRVQLSARELELQPEAFRATQELRLASGELSSVIDQIGDRCATHSTLRNRGECFPSIRRNFLAG